ncbi:sterol desaturase family protein [Flectobacillus sp. DC10W]|jgi:sterol desaturase/sphingolipid hydroxylase (fatty acid hydroxylase superfamily)|uniref:Sterol desaturase family protein n=1 Tax=Flectobacillus longus TaxID=2984207 RepID=A0ABT6YGK1_9BACT|nr:sterol desaturase family protein [Flectobacillus longus]MDI9862714.1 sterol desaturase family protein [Flectobacillus longus]
MHTKYLAFAIPLFLVFMGLEYFLSKVQGKKFYKFKDTIANLNVGIAERLIDCFSIGIFYFYYDYLQKNLGFFDIKSGVFAWIALLLLTDLLWYWYHRLGHEVNILWSVHIVHHQSEEFNFTVSARITIFQAIARTFFWSILPIIGFNADMISIVLLIHGIYPFFTHTRTVGKLGFLEYIFVTPSHHRVHHASNEQYLDKNYSDMFIFWDKLFGTFAEETEEPVYGLTKPLKSYSFLWQHFHYMIELAYAFKHAKTFKERIRIIFGKPETLDPSIREELEKRFIIQFSEDHNSKRVYTYVVVQMISLLIGLFVIIYFLDSISLTSQILWAFFILISLINCGALLEQKRWIIYLEAIRLFIVGVLIQLNYPTTEIFYAIAIIGLVIIAFAKTLKNQYFKLIFG